MGASVSVSFPCDKCGITLKMPADRFQARAGQILTCPNCDQGTRIPHVKTPPANAFPDTDELTLADATAPLPRKIELTHTTDQISNPRSSFLNSFTKWLGISSGIVLEVMSACFLLTLAVCMVLFTALLIIKAMQPNTTPVWQQNR